ncbi:MAG: ankyrin repeat domain-containing protein [Chlorobium sp.]
MSKRWQLFKYSGEEDPSESLLSAVSVGDLEWVRRHLQNGVDVNMRSPDKWTPLIQAAVGDPEITRLLLDFGADPQLHTEEHYTPLMRAAGFGNFEVVKLLVEAGADVFVRDYLGQTALDMTQEVENLEINAYLREAMRQISLLKQNAFALLENPIVDMSDPSDLGLHDVKMFAAKTDQRPRSVPIFLSSTFRDMHAERDFLWKVVFPELEERLCKRGLQLEPIDLRFGVETVSLAEEQEKSLHVLKVCLAEVQRSRPFFLCLLGDRYGSILPEREIFSATREAGEMRDVGQISVTELEIVFALERDPGVRRGLIFMRNPLPYEQLLANGCMSPDEVARFSDLHGDAEKVNAHQKLFALKSRLKSNYSHVVHSYSARWDENKHQLTGLEEWGNQVKELLWAELRDETAGWVQRAEQWQIYESVILHRHWENHHAQFAGRSQELERLRLFAETDEDECWAALLTSCEGYGKSALMATLCYELECKGVFVLSHCVGLTHRSLSIESMLRRFVYELEKRLSLSVELSELSDLTQVSRTFWSLLRQAGLTYRVVLLIDNIDFFRRDHNPFDTTSAGWLSRNWPENVRLIASAREGQTAQSLRDREGVFEISLGELGFDARYQLVQAVCQRYHRDLGQEVRSALIGKTGRDGSFSSGHPLWLSLATEAVNLLDADDFQRLESEFNGDADERIQQLLLHTIGSLPTDVHGLYLWTLQRARDLHGTLLADGFMMLMALSRYGLRESDCRALLPKLTGMPWDSLRFAMLRRTFRSLVQRREDDSRCDFAQQQMRDLILCQFFTETSYQRQLHAKIAVYLWSLPPDDLMRQQETMHHFVQSGDALSAARYLCECANDATPKKDDDLSAGVAAIHILAENIREQRETFVDWMTSWLGLEELDTTSRAMLAGLFGQVLDELLTDKVDLMLRKRMHESIRDYLSGIVTDYNNADIACQLVLNYSAIGAVLQAEGKGDQAFHEFHEGYRFATELLRLHPDRIDAKHNLATITFYIAKQLLDSGLAVKAKPYFEELVQLRREIAKIEPNEDNSNELASALARFGHVCFELHLTAVAKVYFQEARNSVRAFGRGGWKLLGDISEHMGNVADAEGRLDDALGFYQDVVSKRTSELTSWPNDRQGHYRLSTAHKNLGDVYRKLGQFGESAVYYHKALALIQRMIDVDPDNTLWCCESAVLYSRVGSICIDQQQFDDAMTYFNDSVCIFDRLIKCNPGNAKWYGELLETLVSIGDLYFRQECYGQAVSVYTRCIRVAEDRLKLEPDNPTAQNGLVVAYGKVGVAFMSANDYDKARMAFENAIDLAEQNRQMCPDHPYFLEDCVGILWNLGSVYGELKDYKAAEKCFRICRDRLKLMQSKGLPFNNMLRQVWDILSKM